MRGLLKTSKLRITRDPKGPVVAVYKLMDRYPKEGLTRKRMEYSSSLGPGRSEVRLDMYLAHVRLSMATKPAWR